VNPNSSPPARPSDHEIREALERVLANRTFSGASQLSAFLRYVVETTLTGQADEIKGVTVATKALGRGDKFNPKTDAIVRVEAGRLRRAIERYYREDGAHDPIVIEIPRRGYVPSFSYRLGMANEPATPLADCAEPAAIPRAVAPPPAPALTAHAAPYARPLLWILLGTVITAGFYWHTNELPLQLNMIQPTVSNAAVEGRPTRAIGVAIQIDRPTIHGSAAAASELATGLYDGMRDALTRFDDVRVIARDTGAVAKTVSGQPQAPIDYRLISSIDAGAGGPASVTFRLQDPSDDSIVWVRTFERVDFATGLATAKVQIVSDVSTTLLRLYGVIQTNERAKLSHRRSHDPHYSCIVEANDYWRNYDPTAHAQVRSCLERMIVDDSSFAGGYALLARIYLREYQNLGDEASSSRAKLDEALRLASRAVELKPDSARAHYVMMDTQIADGNISEAVRHGEAAIAINPLDENAVVHFGNQLVAIGEFERGLALLAPYAQPDVRQARLDFSFFLAAYMKGDYQTAAKHAHRMPRNTLPLGIVARALTGYKLGKSDIVRREVSKLAEVAPAWRTDARTQLRKIFQSDSIVNQLGEDLSTAAGSLAVTD
jgi:tetratricopeptide (TPR) repeat protein